MTEDKAGSVSIDQIMKDLISNDVVFIECNEAVKVSRKENYTFGFVLWSNYLNSHLETMM